MNALLPVSNHRAAADELLVRQAMSGDTSAYGTLIERYRNMVYGLAYYHLGDPDDARDVAQEVFLRAYQRLSDLRDADRFAPWLRQITLNACRHWKREARRWMTGFTAEALEAARMESAPSAWESIRSLSERLALRQALSVLTPDTRLTILLYYFQERSIREIAAFLEMPETAIKSRLRDARARLRKEMLAMLNETVPSESLPPDFSDKIVQKVLAAANHGDLDSLRTLVEGDTRLLHVRGKRHPKNPTETPLIAGAKHPELTAWLTERGGLDGLTPEERTLAMNVAAFWHNHRLVEALRQRGVDYTIHAAAHLGDADTVRRLLAEDPSRVHMLGGDGETPLHVAATVEVARLLVNAGADLDARDRTYDNTPIEYNSRPGRRDVQDYLISRGATVRFKMAVHLNDTRRMKEYLDADPAVATERGFWGRPDGPQFPLITAAAAGNIAAAQLLLDYGADANMQDDKYAGKTALHAASLPGYPAVVALLLDRGAVPTLRASGNFDEPLNDATPDEWAEFGKARGWGVLFPSNGSGKHDEVIQLLRSAGG